MAGMSDCTRSFIRYEKLTASSTPSASPMAALLDRRGSAAARSSDRASRSGRPAELRPKGLSEHRIGVRHESPMRPRMDIALIDDAKAELLLDAQRCGVAGENAGGQKAMAFAEQAIDEPGRGLAHEAAPPEGSRQPVAEDRVQTEPRDPDATDGHTRQSDGEVEIAPRKASLARPSDPLLHVGEPVWPGRRREPAHHFPVVEMGEERGREFAPHG